MNLSTNIWFVISAISISIKSEKKVFLSLIVLTDQSILTILMFLCRLSLSLYSLSISSRYLLVFTLFTWMLYIIIAKMRRWSVVDVSTILIHSVSFKRTTFAFLVETVILMSPLLILFTSIPRTIHEFVPF